MSSSQSLPRSVSGDARSRPHSHAPVPVPRRPGARTWSWRVGTLVGIPLRVHPSFWLLLGWIALTHALRGHGAREIAAGLALVVSIFACVVLHELGHALVARRFGVRTRDITLLPIGGVAHLERMPEKPAQELLVALAGPAVSLGLSGGLFAALALLDGPTGIENLQLVGGPLLTKLAWINLVIAGFNLLPAFPMDGGRVLRASLAMRMDRGRATDLAARIGQAIAVVLGIWGLFFNFFLALIAAFVWMGARSEASMVQAKLALSGMPVSQAMITDFRALSPSDPLARAVELTLSGFQQEFPVMEGARLVGILTHAEVLEGLARSGANAAVSTAMSEKVETTHPDELLELAFERLEAGGGQALVAVREGQVVGLLTPRNVGEMLTMDRALQRSHSGSPERSA